MLPTVLLLLLLLIFPELALANDDNIARFTCGGVHFVRTDGTGGLEIAMTTLTVRNLDTANSVTWRRLTIRNLFGAIIHDSGPVVGTPLPLNTDLPGGLDVTFVPPGAAFYLSTNHIFGNASVPGPAGQGNNLTTLIELSTTHGKLVEVVQTIRERQLFSPLGAPPFQGPTRTRDGRLCSRAQD